MTNLFLVVLCRRFFHRNLPLRGTALLVLCGERKTRLNSSVQICHTKKLG
ncbi:MULTISPECIES: hypothetical protein [unclassified Campylobacter]|nr:MULTISPECIES: hypothetical protein [unclassified Campylobacter]MDA3078841.1 hypothetical protein [Campylobacter sp. CS_NA2]MDA3080868.1 hypothetical protein [Campylobacter sp. CS_NA1]